MATETRGIQDVETDSGQDLQLELREHEDIAILSLAGELTVFTGKILREAVMRLISNKRFNIIFELSGVDYIDSAGIGCLTWTLKEVYTHGGDLKLARPSRFVKRFFDVLHLDYFMDIYERTEEAVADFRSNLARAIFKWRKIVELKPNYADAHNNLALAYKNSGLFAEARAELLRAIEINPDYLEAYNNLGKLAFQEGRIEEATEYFRKVLEREPDNLEALRNLAMIYDDSNMLEEAIRRYRGAINLYPNYADLHYHLGRVYLKKNDLNGAVASFEEALKLNPDYLEASRALADAYERQGNLEQAVFRLKKVMEITMDGEEKERIREKIVRLQHRRENASGGAINVA